jgi:hypothetical protein
MNRNSLHMKRSRIVGFPTQRFGVEGLAAHGGRT